MEQEAAQEGTGLCLPHLPSQSGKEMHGYNWIATSDATLAKALHTTMDSWQRLRIELEREAEAIFASYGQVVIVVPGRESGSVLKLISGTKLLKVTWHPEKHAVKWETPSEYGFERFPDMMPLLTRSLMQRLRR